MNNNHSFYDIQPFVIDIGWRNLIIVSSKQSLHLKCSDKMNQVPGKR